MEFSGLKCGKRELIKWEYDHGAFYGCLSVLNVYKDRYTGQWVCMLYHNVVTKHPFCGYAYNIVAQRI